MITHIKITTLNRIPSSIIILMCVIINLRLNISLRLNIFYSDFLSIMVSFYYSGTYKSVSEWKT